MIDQKLKRCSSCKVEKSLDNFFPHQRTQDGYRARCKQCDNEISVIKYQTDPEIRKKKLARVKAYYEKNKEKWRDKDRKRREKYPEKYKAKAAINSALESGKIEKKPCEMCGDTKSFGHHPDYNKPLEVQWLCRKHHSFVHRKYHVESSITK